MTKKHGSQASDGDHVLRIDELKFTDVFDLAEIQKLQDAFAAATGVASIITDTDGVPFTQPSNFCEMCQLVRSTELGLANCYKSDAELGKPHPGGAILQPCLSGGLWDGGVSIYLDDRHIANWLIGQILTSDAEVERVLAYGRQVGADPEAFREAVGKVTRMPLEQFEKVGEALYVFSQQLSQMALQNAQQKVEIARREQAERSAQENESRYRMLIESQGEGIGIVDATEHFIFANPAAEALFGVPDGALTGRSLREFTTPEQYALILQQTEKRQHGERSVYEFAIVRADGSRRDVLVTATPQIDANGQAISTFGVFRDITERKRVENALRLEEVRTRALLDLNQMTGASLKEIADFALEAALQLADSPLGYLAFTNADETVLTMYSWSKSAMAECAIVDKPVDYPVETTGLWGEALRQRKPIITNEYAAPNPYKKGYPQGHVHLARHMNIPVFDGDHIVAVAGVGNKTEDYTDDDVQQLTLLMQGMWRLIRRLQDEAALREREQQLSGLAQNVPGVVYQFYATPDGQLGVDYVSERVADIFGLMGDVQTFFPEFLAHVHEEDRARFMASIQEVVATVSPWNFEGRFVKPSGETLWFNGLSTPIRKADRLVFNGILLDITERKQAEASLAENTARLRNILDALPLGMHMYRLEPDGRLVFTGANVAADRLLGVDNSIFVGKTIEEAFPPLMQTEVPTRYREAAGEGERWRTQQIAYHEGQIQGAFEVYAFQTSPGEMAAGFLDVTERMRGEAERARLSAILENTSDLVSTSTPDGRLTYLNDAGRKMIGWPEDEDITKHVIPDVHPAWALEITGKVGVPTAIEKGIWQGESALKRVDGTEIPVSQVIMAHKSASGDLEYLSTVMRDIRDIRTAQAALAENTARLRNILDALPFGMHMYRLEPDGRLVFTGANAAADRLLGVDNSIFVGKTIEEAFPPLSETEVPTRYRAAAAEGKRWQTQQIAYDQGQIQGAFEVYAFQTSPGEMAAGFLDATERMRAQTERERFIKRLDTAADIAGQVAAILNPDELLRTVIPLIKERFGLYYVHVYTLDEDSGLLNLRAGYGEPGRIMLERGHSIPLSREQSLVATAARTGKPVLVNDVTRNPNFMPNPLLPDTKSEVAVPAVVGGKVLGVFDVQHDKPDYFTQADLDVFLTLAGQIATALQNARYVEEVARQRAFYDGIITNLPVGVWAVDQQFQPLMVNPAGRDMMGREVKDQDGGAYVENYDVINVNTGELYDNLQLPLVKAVTQGGMHTATDAGVRWPDGTVVPMLINAAALTDPDGTQTGAVVIFVDATEQRQAQAAAERERDRAQMYLNVAGSIIVVLNTQGEVVLLNRRGLETLGYAEGEILGKNWFDFTVPEAIRNAVKGVFADIMAGKIEQTAYYENEITSKAGERRLIAWHNSLLKDAEGRIIGSLSSGDDITERKLSEQRLNIQYAVARLLAESPTLAEAMPQLLQTVCQTMQWEWGELWQLDPRTQTLHCEVTWYTPDSNLAEFDEATRHLTFTSGVGLPGRVLSSGQPAWIIDVAKDPNFPRGLVAIKVGLHGAFAVPIVLGKEFWGVLGFLSREIQTPDADLLQTFAAIGSQVGQFMERKQVEIEVHASEQRFRDIVVNTAGWVWEVNAQGQYTYCSEKVAEVLGYTVEEVLGKTPFDFMIPEEVARIAPLFGDIVTRKANIIDLENWNFCKDGSRICLLTNGVAILDETGALQGYRGVDTDITERKKAEAAILQERNFSKTVINSLPGVFYLFDKQGHMIQWNSNYETVTGYTTEETSKRNALDPILEEDRPMVAAAIARVFTEGFADVEGRMRSRSGEITPYYFVASRLQIGDNLYVIGSGIDITDRKRAEAERERFATHLRVAAEITTEISAILDADALFERLVRLTKERFNLYHTQFYDLDATSQTLKLRFGYGQAGQVMKQRGYKVPLKVGRDLVARAARTKEVVVAHDLTQEADYTPNMLLLDARSEVALPLVVGGRVLGVFDVMADHVEYFTSAMVDVLKTLLGQVVTTLQNVQYFAQQKEAEGALRNSSEQIRAMFDAMGDGVVVSNMIGEITDMNEASFQLLGYADREDLLRHNILEMITPADRSQASVGWAMALESGRSGVQPVTLQRKDGSIFAGEMTAALLRDVEGNPVGFINICRNVAGRK